MKKSLSVLAILLSGIVSIAAIPFLELPTRVASVVTGYLMEPESSRSIHASKSASTAVPQSPAFFNNNYHDLAAGDFSQNWNNTGLITTEDDWSGVPSIIGYRGDGLSSSNTTDPQTVLAPDTVVDVNPQSSAFSSTGGVHEIESPIQTIAMQGSTTADAPNIVLHLNSTGRQNVVVSYFLVELDASTANQLFAIQYRIGESGNFTNIPNSANCNGAVGGLFNTSNNQALDVSCTLPSAVDNQSQVQVRIITNDALGSDAMVGIENIQVTSVSSGVPAIQVSPTVLNFGDAVVGTTTGTQSVMVTNTGTADLVLGTPGFVTGDHFGFSPNPNGTTIGPAESAQISFVFSPATSGAKSDTAIINSNAPGPAPSLTLTGSGVPANTPPVAVDDEATTPQDQALVLNESDLVGNDIDPDVGQTLTITAVSAPVNGTVSIDAGTITFTPTGGFTGTAGFDYTVSDGVDTDTGHVTVTVSPLPDFVTLQWPPTFSGTGGQPSDTIYGQIYEPGITDSPGQGAGVTAQVGYGPLGSDPRVDLTWVFTAAAFNGDQGNNDEYAGTFTLPNPASTTQYSYTYRFSLDGGTNWTYGDLDGSGTLGGTFDPANVGTMTVDPADVTPPDTTITGGPSGTVTDSTAIFNFNSSEGGSTFECSLDGAAFTSCSSGVEYTGLTNGNHYFQVRATDAADNTDGSPASSTFTVRAGLGAITFIVDRLDDSASADECIDAVPNDCSLRRAIGTSNSGDTITFDPSLFPSPLGPEGVPPAVIPLGGTEIPITTNITITGPGASLLTIDAGGLSRIYNVVAGTTASISGMTLTGGFSNNPGTGGGAILVNNGANLTLTGMTLSGNSSNPADGGALLNRGTATIGSSTFSNNTSASNGGAISSALGSAMTITDSVISNNSAGSWAGGIMTEVSITISGSTVSGNTAGIEGGGIRVAGATTVGIENSSISGNSAVEGGGVWSNYILNLTNTTVSGNTASASGGGVKAFGVNVTGSTFTDNCVGTRTGGICTPAGQGGAIETAGDILRVRNSTFSNNAATTGGGIYYLWASPNESVISSTFVNSTITVDAFGLGGSLPAYNSIISGGGCSGADTGFVADGGFNLDSGNSCGFTAPTSHINTDPLLGPLQDNGGPTWTHGFNLSLGLSPAIDQGSAFGLTTDQRGMPRPADLNTPNAAGGDGSDIGAYELMAPTAAPASISGRVMTSSGSGIRGAVVTVQDMNGGLRSFVTSTYGYYRIEGLATGQTYFISVSARRYVFANGTQLISLDDNITGLDFTATQ